MTQQCLNAMYVTNICKHCIKFINIDVNGVIICTRYFVQQSNQKIAV